MTVAPQGCQPASRDVWHPSAGDTFCVVAGAMMAGFGALSIAGISGFAAIVGLMIFLLGLACDLRRATMAMPLEQSGSGK